MTIRYLIKFIVPKKIISILVDRYSKFYVPLLSKKMRVILREKTSDFEVFRDIFILNHLKMPIPLKPKVIIDCGAYVGYSSIFYTRKYPNAKLYSFEPEKENFKLLQINTANYKNIQIFNKGIWYKDTYLRVIDNNRGNYGFVVEECTYKESEIEAISIDRIFKIVNNNKIDLIKLDIEGTEKLIFTYNYESWINNVNVFFIETHDRFIENCYKTVRDAFAKHQFIESKIGEYHVFINKNFIATS